MSQVAYVDLSKRKVICRPIPEELLRLYLGGRGLNAYLLFNHLPPGTDPLSPDNVLIFGSGMLNGHLDVSNGRWHVTGKSPETGINGDSNAGGFWGAELKQAGFQHLVIKGKATTPTYLWIHDGEIEFRDASFLWGRDAHETQELIMDELGDPHVQIACIGQAGEQLVRFACVRHGLKHAAGRTGMGCTMGSKMLKAIAVRGTLGLKAKNPNALLKFAASHYKKLISTKQYPVFSRYGTLVIFAMTNEMGLLGAYNHQYNHFEEAEGELEAEIFDEKYKVGTLTCFACPLHCVHRYRIKSGPYQGTWGEGPEWYFMGGFGPNVGNADWDIILVANDLCNRYGLDVGSVSSYLGWLMELWQRGIIDEKFTGGLYLEWGNKEAIIAFIHQVAMRQGLGDRLANGWRSVAEDIGGGVERYIPHTKGLPIESAIDDRALKATPLGQSTSNRGYDHLRGRVALEFFNLPEDILAKIYGKRVSSDIDSWEGKPWMAYWTQMLSTIADSTGVCKFATPWTGSTRSLGFKEFGESINAVTGWDLSVEDLMEIGQRIWNMERLFNARESDIRRDGDMPPEVFYDPNKLEPFKDAKIDKDAYQKALDEYYRILGWNKDGTPTKETQVRLKLDTEPSHLL